jgi:restriction system protein
MTIVEAIKAVMRDAGHPLSAREAHAKIVEQGLYAFQAKDPQHVVLMQIRRHCLGLDFPSAATTKHFRMVSDNQYEPIDASSPSGPRKTRKAKSCVILLLPSQSKEPTKETPLPSVEKQLWQLHKRYLDIFKKHMLQELKRLPPEGFEAFAKELLEAYGFEDMKVTSVSRDGGIDGHGRLKVGLAYLNVAFQCKRWTKAHIHRPEIDRFRGAAQGRYEQGIFFTTSSFSQGAIDVTTQPGAIPIVMLDGKAIVNLMIERRLRVESSLMEIPTFAL